MSYRTRMLGQAKDSGQAAVETAIVVPMMTFTMLGIIQMTMMQQAALMLEYAAFSAARAGSVWNMDNERMEKAARLVMLPVSTKVSGVGELATKAALSMALDAVLGGVGLPKQMNLTVLSPKESDFGGKKEIEFDDGSTDAARQKSRLVIRLLYFYELRLPIINRVFWEGWYASMAKIRLTGYDPFRPKVDTGLGSYEMAYSARLAAEAAKVSVSTKWCKYSGLKTNHLKALAGLAAAGKFIVPMVTTYTIRMQSNPFVHKPGDSSKKWAAQPDGC